MRQRGLFTLVHSLTQEVTGQLGAAAPYVCRLMRKFSPGRRADTQDLAASARQRHFSHFVKLT